MRSLIAIILAPLLVLAIEAMAPNSLCDRFITAEEQASCQKRIKEIKPDSYLAGVCQKQYDNDSFWTCLQVGAPARLDPRVVDGCAGQDMDDQQRIDCLQNAIKSKNSRSANEGTTQN